MVWAYNDYATRGIKEVCEFGYTSTLEEEMRRQVRSHYSSTGSNATLGSQWWRDIVTNMP